MSHLILERPLWSLWRAVLPKVILLACLIMMIMMITLTMTLTMMMEMMIWNRTHWYAENPN